jgi:hypothetical protein
MPSSKKSAKTEMKSSKPRSPQVNHRREKYLEKKVARLRAHNKLIQAKARKKRAKIKLLNFFEDVLERLQPGRPLE